MRTRTSKGLPKLRYGTDGADTWRYIYILNYTDQTVSVFDTSSHSVVATITLTASKSLRSIQYVPYNKSVYVIATAWYDRIDANPSSGTFNTVVQSGSFTSNSAAYNLSWVDAFNGFITGAEIYFIASDNSVNFHAASNNKWAIYFTPVLINDGRNTAANDLSRASAPVLQIGDTGLFLTPACNSGLNFSLFKYCKVNGRNAFVDVSLQEGKNKIAYPSKIGNFLITGRGNSGEITVLDIKTGLTLTSFAVSPTDRISTRYTPVGGEGGRVFVYQKLNTNVNISVIDWATKTDLGDISRSGYKATDENCTKQGIYCPYDKNFYVLSGTTGFSGTSNKLHRYDPTQVLASMYVNSYTVGNNATNPGDYLENIMCMNGIEAFDYNDPCK